jgi:hypothetical protein
MYTHAEAAPESKVSTHSAATSDTRAASIFTATDRAAATVIAVRP